MSKSGGEEQPKRRNWASPIARDAAALGQSAFLRAGFTDPTLVLNWDAIAGPETARLARPLRVTEGRHGGVLTLLCEPGASVFLQHDSRALCDRINTFLGRVTVTRLKFVQGSLSRKPEHTARPKPPELLPESDPAMCYRGPEGLREAIWRLARARRSRG